jgi:hypothetical protein
MIVPEFSYTYSGKTFSATGIAIRFGDDSLMRRSQATVFPVAYTNDKPRVLPSNRVSITLWSGDEYDAIGDYTQAQVEARVLEVVGDLAAAFSG